jgi:hypothetical protein
MRLLPRRRELPDDRDELRDDTIGDDAVRRDVVSDDVVRDEAVEPEYLERRELVDAGWNPANVLVVLAGAALAALGIVALVRTEINETWYTPVEDVANINHTPLLAAIEVGVGALLVILGLAGVRALTAFVCLAAAVAAAVAAIDPGLFETELAIERWWAIALAAAGGTLAVLLMLPRPMVTVERSRPTFRRRSHGRIVQQH